MQAIDQCDVNNADFVTALYNTQNSSDAIIGSKIWHDCGYGRAFSDNYLQIKENFCYFNEDNTTIDWYYTNTNTLPSCIRKKLI